MITVPRGLSATRPQPAKRESPQPTAFTLNQPDQTAVLPAMNGLMFDLLNFNVSAAGMAGSALSIPLHLKVAGASGDVTYDLPLQGNKMSGSGTLGGLPFDEQWTFGKTLHVQGAVGMAPESLDLAFDQTGWKVDGQVGTMDVHEQVKTWDKFPTRGFVVDGTVGGQSIHQEFTTSHAGDDGQWHTDMQSPTGSAHGDFHALSDRTQVDAHGTSGTLPWNVSGQIIFTTPSPPDSGQGNAAFHPPRADTSPTCS